MFIIRKCSVGNFDSAVENVSLLHSKYGIPECLSWEGMEVSKIDQHKMLSDDKNLWVPIFLFGHLTHGSEYFGFQN